MLWLVDIVFPMGLQSPSDTLVLPLALPRGNPGLSQMVGYICICICQVLVELLREQPYDALASKCFLALSIVPGFTLRREDGSLGGTVPGWPFLQSLLQFLSLNFISARKLMG